MKRLGDIIHSLVKGHFEDNARSQGHGPRARSEGFDFLALIEAWPQVVGERMAALTKPMQNKGGTLTVMTAHPAYGQQLLLLSPTIIGKITKHFPALQGKIQKLQFQTNSAFFIQRAPVDPNPMPLEKARPQGPHPLSP